MLQSWLLGRTKELTNWKAADLCEDNRIDGFDMIMVRRLLVDHQFTDWSDELPTEGAVNVETRTEYRVAKKEFKETEEKLDNSWTLEDKSTVYEWSPYSEYSTTEVKETDSCKVQKLQKDEKHLIGYSLFYKCGRNPSTLERWYFNENPPAGYDTGYGINTSDMWGISWIISPEELKSATKVGIGEWFNASSGGYSGYNRGTTDAYYVPSHPETLWFKGDAVYENKSVTYYSYSTRSTKTVYKYSKVGEYSEWTTEKPVESENTVVETRTTYRYINK